MRGSDFDDSIVGEDSNNVLEGQNGNDHFEGRGGNDILVGGAGADSLDGGAGTDRASYTNATAGLTVNLGNPASNTGEAIGDTFIDIEGLQGSTFNDTLVGDSNNNFLIGGAGPDVLNGGAGNDTADYRTSTSGLTIDLANPANNTGDGVGDTYISIERLQGSDFGDNLFGNNGNNNLDGGAGADHLVGRGGFDFARYQSSTTTGVIASLANPNLNTGDAAGDSYISIEGLIGSDFNDTLVGDNVGNSLEGGAGADVLDGGLGFDYARYRTALGGITASLLDPLSNTGEATEDTYVSLEGIEGSDFNDNLFGDAGLNVLVGAAGADNLDGQGGFDYAAYFNSSIGLTVSLSLPANNTGEAAGDIFVSIEGVIGSDFADILVGDANNQWLVGGAGADQLDGQGGTDLAGYWVADAAVTASSRIPR